MPTRADLICDAATVVGGYSGTLGTLTTTSAVLTGLVNASADDSFAEEALLLFPDAANETDKQRNVVTWTPLTGIATWSGVTTGPMGTRWVLMPRPAWTMYEWRQAMNKALSQTARTYRKVIPIVPNLTVYPLSLLDWLEGAKDVDAAWVSSSPIMNHNEDFSLWWDGTTNAPDGWTLSGADASLVRASGGLRSAYAVTVTSGAAEDAVLYQAVPQPLVQWLTRRTSPTYEPIKASAWIASGQGTVGIYDGTTETKSTLATFTYPSYQKTQVTPTSTMTQFVIRLTVPAGENSTTFHFGGIWQETEGDNQSIKDMGSQAYPEWLLEPHNIRNVGGIPTVELPWQYVAAPGQIIVNSRRHFPEFSSDTENVEDQFYRAIEAGTVRWLLDGRKAGQDRTRLDAIMTDHGRIWVNLNMNLIDIPVPRPANQTTVMGV